LALIHTHFEVLVDGVHENKEDISAVGDVHVSRRLAQFDAGDRGSLGQCAAVTVVL